MHFISRENTMRVVIFLGTLIIAFCNPVSASMMLNNGGFETGDLSGWNQEIGAGVVVSSSSNNRMNPSTPHSGSFFFSSSSTDGGDREGGNEITISQFIDVTGFTFISTGAGRITANGFFAGADGGSNDTGEIIVQFFEGGQTGNLLSAVNTTPIDPIVGFWNEVTIAGTAVPLSTDTIVFRVRTVLDPGFSSIDIGGDDFSLSLTAVPVPPALLLFSTGLGLISFLGYRGRKRR